MSVAGSLREAMIPRVRSFATLGQMNLPLALTMGDPAGIGGEITLKAWLLRGEKSVPPFFVIGDPSSLSASLREVDVPLVEIESPDQSQEVFSYALPVWALKLPSLPRPGYPNPDHALSVIRSIELAVEFVRGGRASAVVTNPVHKGVLRKQVGEFTGHTGYLAKLSQAPRPVMMLSAGRLRVIPITTHLPLREAIKSLQPDEITAQAKVVHLALRQYFGIEHPRLAISALNPHAGEGGMMGCEESELIVPAVEQLRCEGMAVAGPLPADSLFHQRARRDYDAALCMYHDQALIAVKTLEPDCVNITLGLPFVRTSPGHGTAFDIAGHGQADPASLIAALQTADMMACQTLGPHTYPVDPTLTES